MPTLANMQNVNGITIAAGADVTTDRHILLGTQTASSSATLSFSGLNSHRSDVLRSSFDVLEFRFTNMHPATDNVYFRLSSQRFWSVRFQRGNDYVGNFYKLIIRRGMDMQR